MSRCIFNSKLANLILLPGYQAITLFGFSFFKDSEDDYSNRVVNHECIHQVQQIEMIGAGFALAVVLLFALLAIFGPSWYYLWLTVLPFALYYIWYFFEWVIALPVNATPNDSYHTIAFEEEAYENETNQAYLCTRTSFSWVKYLGNVKRIK